MASGGVRKPTVSAVDKGMGKAIVTCEVEGLQVGFIGSKPKNATVSVKITEWGFDLKAVVKDKGKETMFQFAVKKFPGAVNVDDCTWKAEKGKVVITLVKVKEESWEAQLSMRGIDQQSDDEDN